MPEDSPEIHTFIPPDPRTSPEFFNDKSKFVRAALAEFLRSQHLPALTFLELSPANQSRVLSRAAAFEGRSREGRSPGHEGAARE